MENSSIPDLGQRKILNLQHEIACGSGGVLRLVAIVDPADKSYAMLSKKP